MISYFGIHNHTAQGSNNRFLDAMNDVPDIIKSAHDKGLAGIGLTDHGTLSAHFAAERYLDDHKEELGDFKVTYGIEAYLVHKKDVEYARDNNVKTDWFHFVLTAKNKHGYKFLRELSSQAWKDSFFFRGMRRLPTFWENLPTQMQGYKGDVIASTACLGSEISKDILAGKNKEANTYVQNLVQIFGKENVVFEIMPADNEEQKKVNAALVDISSQTGIKYVVSTDAHYIDLNDQDSHETFLKSENQARDVRGFYQYAHLFTPEEIYKYIDKDIADKGFKNSLDLLDTIETYSLKHVQEIPKAPIPDFKPVTLKYDKLDWSKYPEIEWLANSKEKANQYYLYLILNGMVEKKQPFDETHLGRINEETKAVHAVSDYLGQPLSQYFLTLVKLLDIIWNTDSLVGPGRGSVGCFYCAYLLGITQINAIDYNLPYWRFLSAERADDLADVDQDTESAVRGDIIEAFKNYFGNDHVLNFGTFNTQAPASTVLTACRGLQIDLHEARNLTNSLPKDRMVAWPIHDAIYGNEKKGRKPDKKFNEMISKYPRLKETMLQIEGKIRGVSQHASGVLITNGPYTDLNAMMMTQSGLPITQYEAHDSEAMGGLKYDILTLNALDRIHEAIRLLIKDGKIKWQGTLRDTYEKYFGVDKLEMKDPKMFDMLFDDKIVNAFEFDTIVGSKVLHKMNARTFDDLIAANALMRLNVDEGEQPIDKYIRFRKDINEWYQEMREYGLSNDEIEVMREHLERFNGICYSQETLMSLSMDKRITGFDLLEANKLRKSIAKKDEKLYNQEREEFFEKGRALGTSDNLLTYVFDNCAEPAKHYSFNLAHGTTYTLLLMVEMNIAYRYGEIYWQTACLSVNAGIYGNTFKNTDYAKMSKAMGDMSDKIVNPDINKSDYGFKPDVEHNKILFGLFPIVGIGKEDAKTIIDNRPYSSLQEFIDKTGFTNKKVVTLIKSGAFDSIEPNRRKLMMNYVQMITPLKEKLTTVQLPKLMGHIPDKYQDLVDLYVFRNKITGHNKVKMNQEIEDEFFDKYEQDLSKAQADSWEMVNGELAVDVKKFNKWYNKQITPLKEWLKTPEACKIERAYNMNEFWKNNCIGNANSWEAETLSFYILPNELTYTDILDKYKTVDFNKQPKNPEIHGWYKSRNGKSFPIYAHSNIAGLVISKDVRKNMIFILDQQKNVIPVRVGSYQYKKFDKRSSNSKSFFERGTKLMLVGYRRNDDFYVNNKNSVYEEPIYKIEGYNKKAHLVKK